jgi:hypothetical protein
MKFISEIEEEESLPVFDMNNLKVLVTCLCVVDEADNGRKISTDRHYIHELDARTTFLIWKIEFGGLTVTSLLEG